MVNKKKIRLMNMAVVASLGLFGCKLEALTLKESVAEALITNPIVQERLKNFRETQQDLNIAQSEYLPVLDLKSSFGTNSGGNLKSNTENSSYQNYTNSLKLTQNIFNGFSTSHKVDYQKARILAAAYNYLENANDVAFQMVEAYLDVIRAYKLLQNAKESVAINQNIYNNIQELFDSGLTTKSETTKVYASLSLAKSNMIVQENNAIDKEFKFKRIFGRNINVWEMEMPSLDMVMPESIQRATMYAIQNNPSVLVSEYNIQSAQALYKEKKSSFYPKVDFELEQLYNGNRNKENRYDQTDDRLKAYVTLNWNLYRGGADKAAIQRTRSTIHKEVESKRDIKRQTIEAIELSWSAYHMIANQLNELYRYYEYSKETLESYQQEYDMGRRTLLDLLSVQNDLINSKSQIINAETDRLFAQYRILDAMGILVSTIAGDTEAYSSMTLPVEKPFYVTEDSLPINLDRDGDGIVDSLDICQSSVEEENIMPYGCVKGPLDSDYDGVPDMYDMCPDTKFGAVVDEKGCEIIGVPNKFAVDTKVYTSIVEPYNENSPHKSPQLGLYDYEYSTRADNNTLSTDLDNQLMYDNFELIQRFPEINMTDFKTELTPNTKIEIAQIATSILKNKKDGMIITVIGHTKTITESNENQHKSLEYAQVVKNELITNGIPKEAIQVESRFDKDKLYLKTYPIDDSLNDRVMVSLYVPQDIPSDSDGDGVIDIYDLCPNTPTGYKVNKDGCCLDDDNDGVINELDLCPNTPSGYVVDEHGCSVKRTLHVLFAHDSYVINLDSIGHIAEFAQFLKDHPYYNIVLTGHTSKTPTSTEKYNLKLSLKRAESIKAFLIANGVEESRINAVGKGFSEPIATNDTLDGQSQNRRIEVELIDVNKLTEQKKIILETDTLSETNKSVRF
ncbi:TolC family outer membrane protein [Arcobacter sp. FWKO B]|uniref:TolC family outer membrane protein n=1 Tax=Arcobacter sp. FWKO B TaxID=2593672 RepID=UPI0018A6651E|nr:TolC family outer membrane protein [Arcobacter sp. FWKO B]QOG11365.1 TolC family outer membrane protein [Arcobacter sp. FWKO B]